MSSNAVTLEEAMHFSQQGAEALQEARNREISTCMARSGFSWFDAPDDPFLLASPHGLFQLETPSAIRAYRLERGYGVAAQVEILRRSSVLTPAQEAFEEYLATLSPSAKKRFVEALNGTSHRDGCMTLAVARTGGIAALGNDGDFVHAYGDALFRYRQDPRVLVIESKVIDCLDAAGYSVQSLDELIQEFQLRFVRMVDGTAHFDDRGRMHWEWGALEGENTTIRIPQNALEELRADEFAAARREVMCRDRYQSELDAVLAAYSAPLLEQYAAEIRQAANAYEAAGEGEAQ